MSEGPERHRDYQDRQHRDERCPQRFIPRDSFTTACAQACPTEAIVFGDIKDPESRVSKMKEQDRNYGILEYLNVVPRTSYLARIRNPNPKMPDAKDIGVASLVETFPE